MSNAIANFEDLLSKNLIIDPSALSSEGNFQRLHFIMENFRTKTVIVPTSLHKVLKEKDNKGLLQILRKWQWRLPIEETARWIESSIFVEEVSYLLDKALPASEFWRLDVDPTIIEEIALEIREVASRRLAPLVSGSRSFKHWLSKKAVTVLEVTDEHYRSYKRWMRRRYRESLRTRLGVNAIQVGLAGGLLITIILASKSSPSSDWEKWLPSVATGGSNAVFKAIVIDP